MIELYLKTREDWRNWLAKNYASSDGVWFVFYKKDGGKPSLDYEAFVEEALCFGWIDSLIRKLDDIRYARKVTPRKDDSKWSETNKRRVQKMIRQGLMTTDGQAKIDRAKALGTWSKPDRLQIPTEMPEALATALQQNKQARDFFDSLAPSYRKLYIAWIATAKREETRAKRTREAIRKLEKGEKLGLV